MIPEIILDMGSANQRRHYYVMPPLIGWAHTQNDPWSHSGYGISQWEEALLCNASSHWLSPYPEWSLYCVSLPVAGLFGPWSIMSPLWMTTAYLILHGTSPVVIYDIVNGACTWGNCSHIYWLHIVQSVVSPFGSHQIYCMWQWVMVVVVVVMVVDDGRWWW